jgi:hypothetical protein
LFGHSLGLGTNNYAGIHDEVFDYDRQIRSTMGGCGVAGRISSEAYKIGRLPHSVNSQNMENDFDLQDFFNFDFEVDLNLELPDPFGIGTSLHNLDLGVETAVADTVTTTFQTPLLFESLESRFTEVEEEEIPRVSSFQISSAADFCLEFQSQSIDLEPNLNTTLIPVEKVKLSSDANAPSGNADLSSGVVVEKKKRLRPLVFRSDS